VVGLSAPRCPQINGDFEKGLSIAFIGWAMIRLASRLGK
jgi:hypothetical protein